MRLDIVYYRNGVWWSGFLTGSQFSWIHSSSNPIKNLDTIRSKVNMYLPLRKYTKLYLKERYMLNDLGVDNFIKRTKEYLLADGVWVDDSVSTLGNYKWT